ncbi:MAG: hypothetical protein KJ583_05645, partial [Nanoarchaeota archaeon]|nr:hypothetical protein [Nanoarchaeota archaeon]MBU1604774.1 hypothetical protein [Nanoarchaeota archaeon]
EKKNPTLAAILNFLVPGIGYLYARKRETFGWIVLTATILSTIYSFNKPELVSNFMFVISSIVLSTGFAYDVYVELKPRKK